MLRHRYYNDIIKRQIIVAKIEEFLGLKEISFHGIYILLPPPPPHTEFLTMYDYTAYEGPDNNSSNLNNRKLGGGTPLNIVIFINIMTKTNKKFRYTFLFYDIDRSKWDSEKRSTTMGVHIEKSH